MLDAPGIKEKFFIWFIRPFARRSRAEVPEGVTDEELIRRGELVQRRYTLLSYATLALVAVALGLIYKVSGLGPVRRPDDLCLEANSPWLPAFVLAIGLCCLFAASPWAYLVGGKAMERDYRLAFEAKHQVNVRRILFLCGLPVAALGVGVLWLCGDHIAFDRSALRWRQSAVEQSRPLADIAEVRFYRRRQRVDGNARDYGDSVIVFRDGSLLVPRRHIDPSIGLGPADCAALAQAAGVPAYLDLDVLPLEDLAR